jgi:hypothetical protein
LRVLKTKSFARWARRERLADELLAAAVDEMRLGLVDAQLGAGLVKKRVARAGGGKSGAYRTLIATDSRERWFFLYGFSKSERDNVDDKELSRLKTLGQLLLRMDEETIRELLEAGELMEVKHGEPQAS